MYELFIEVGMEVIATLLLTLIGVLGAWLTAKIAKREELACIAAATEEASEAAQKAVLELQQTVVEGMKSSCEDGKLTESEINALGAMLLEKALAQISDPAKKLLAAAGKDINAIIKSTGEAMILGLKKR